MAGEYIAGAIILGAAPCTAMVFVWSYLTDGDPNYTLVQVSVNDLIILVAFIPIVGLLPGITNITIPYDTLVASVVIFVVFPLVIQTYFIFFLAWFGGKKLKLPHATCAPVAMIGASNFFELAVAVAIALFGLNSPATLVTVVGVLVEVPVMLSLVALANRWKY